MRLLRPTRLLSTLVITLALAGSMFVSTSSATASTSTPSNARAGAVASVSSMYDAQIRYWTNRARSAHHLRPLVARSCVDRYAERWTVTMARYSRFSHQNLMPILRRCHRTAAAENIAVGSVADQRPHVGADVDALAEPPPQPAQPEVPLHRGRRLAFREDRSPLRDPGLHQLTHTETASSHGSLPVWRGSSRWRLRQDSNLRHLVPETSALSPELRRPAPTARSRTLPGDTPTSAIGAADRLEG